MNHVFTSLLCALAITSTAFAKTSPFAADDFVMSSAAEKFSTFIESFNVEDPSILFELKTTSTSVGIRMSTETINDKKEKDTEKLGTWLPKNSAADLETQTVANYLGQFFHMSQYVTPSDYLPLGPKATARFKSILNCAKGGKMWKDNCKNISAQLSKTPYSIDGVLRDNTSGEAEVPNMIANAKPNGTLNTKHTIAQFISAAGPMPSADKKIDLGVKFKDPKDKTKKILGTDTELNLARQFSKIMVLDILTGQWDRFSGGNIEALYNKKKGVVQFIARDNGGASMTGNGYSLYYTFLSRFDADQMNRVERLLNLLQSHPQEVVAALHMRSKPETLIKRCQKLLAHVQATQAKYGANKTFFPAE